jgi:AcrR family transcriptional regulator
MTRSQYSLDKQEKTGNIVNAAQVRFGIYGIEKTTMREIAADLNMSKGSLYYYFPDKEHLYKAVIEKELSEFIFKLQEKINQIDDPVLIMREYVKTRLGCFRSLLNLSRLRLESYSELKPLISDFFAKFRENEKEIIKSILTTGNKSGLFKIEDIDGTASLFLDILRGLRINVVNSKKMLYIEQEEYDTLLLKTEYFTEIFIKGLIVR